jgi:hypothetical protein
VNVSDQVDALQQRAAELKSSFDAARRETNDQVKARIDNLKAGIATRQDAAKEKAEQAADRTQGQWRSLKADAAAKRADRPALTANATSVTPRGPRTMPRTPRPTPPMPSTTPRGLSTRLSWPCSTRLTLVPGPMPGLRRRQEAERQPG